MGWRFQEICVAFRVTDLVVFDVITFFQDIRRWLPEKIEKDLMQDQKENSYLIENCLLYTLLIRNGGNRQDLSGRPGQIEIPLLLRL